MNTLTLRTLCLLLLVAPAGLLRGGGSGLNVAVVVNQASSNSVRLGNYYCERRQVPPQNLVRIVWTGGNVEWTRTQFTNTLVAPLNAALAARQLTNQIDYVLLSMDIPYRVTNNTGTVNNNFNSTTTVLFYGFKDNPADPNYFCTLPGASLSQYVGSEYLFRSLPPGSSSPSNFLAMMLTASNLPQARLVVDQGVASDGTFPTQTVYLAKSGDVRRNIRYLLFDNAIFNTRLQGNYSMIRTSSPCDSGCPITSTNMLGYANGYYKFSILPNAFVPGAMADSLTSSGGKIYEWNDHTILLVFLNAGAAGSYGTVVEPCAYFGKFPTPQNYFYQARGFSLAECYYQSITNPYQGLLVGELLAAPFARPASGSWLNLPTNAVVSGTTNLALQFTASDPNHPVQQADLFLDGTFAQTLTNIAPRRFNTLHVAINGQTMSYTVQNGDTIYSVASGLAGVLNQNTHTNATKVRAFAHGDRIELQSFQPGRPGDQVSISVSNAIGGATALTTFITASRTNFLDTVAYGLRNFLVDSGPTYPPPVGAWLQLTFTKTNSSSVAVGVTNTVAGTTVPVLVSNLINQVNADPQLALPDGCVAEDFIDYSVVAGNTNDHRAEFNLLARNNGWKAADIQVALTGSATAFTITPPGTQKLDENVADLQPRNHLYLTAGVTNLSLTFPFNTTTQPDGFHELTAVVYEGSHVRTQKRVAQTVRIQNTPLAATFTCSPCDTNTAVEATIQFSVVANTNNVTNIVLYSTGGALATNQSSATFSIAGTNLDLGLHPFYALVTRNDGKQYRTETKWIRLVGAESPFPLSIAAPPPALSWPATAGRRYDILSADLVTNTFQVLDTLTPSNAAAQWADTNATSPERYYRVRTAQ